MFLYGNGAVGFCSSEKSVVEVSSVIWELESIQIG